MRFVFCFIVLMLTSACFHKGGVESTPKPIVFKVYAPIDGHITKAPSVGSVFLGGPSKSQQAFDSLRDENCNFAKKYRYADFECVEALYGSPSPSAPIEGQSVMTINSDVLQIKLSQERIRFRISGEKLATARALLDLETGLKPRDLSKSASDAQYRREMVRAERNKHDHSRHSCDLPNRACNGGRSADRIRNHGNNAATQSHATFKARLNHKLDTDLPNKFEIAKKELEQAKAGLDLLEATIQLGEMTCMKTCRVEAVHVMQGQFVNKGDLVYEVSLAAPSGS